MLKKIGLGALVLIASLVLVIALQPSTFHVERKVTIAAPPRFAHAIVNDFHAWTRFNPWDKLDPSQKVTHGGATAGKGATFAWAGNENVGEGKMTIEESTPESIAIKQEFFKPFPGVARITFAFKPAGAATDVTWSIDGANDFVGKAMCLVMNMDSMIGTKFEEGLARLKTAAEEDARAAAKPAAAK